MDYPSWKMLQNHPATLLKYDPITGYFYKVYKIFHNISLAEHLCKSASENQRFAALHKNWIIANTNYLVNPR